MSKLVQLPLLITASGISVIGLGVAYVTGMLILGFVSEADNRPITLASEDMPSMAEPTFLVILPDGIGVFPHPVD